jgi:hypothetical protein
LQADLFDTDRGLFGKKPDPVNLHGMAAALTISARNFG